jgi:hypothetical protein
MQLPYQRTLEAGQRVQAFLDEESDKLGNPITSDLRSTLDRGVAELAAFKVELGETTGSALGTTAVLKAIRQELYDRFMVPISRISKVALRKSTDLPHLIVPSIALSSGRVGDFLTAADNMLAAAERNAAALQAGGLVPTELALFKEAITKFDALNEARNKHLGRRAASASGLDEVNQSVRTTIGVIDGILRERLKTNGSLRGRWAVARRIAKVAVQPNPTGNDDAATSPDESSPTTPALTVTDGKAAA